MKTKIFTGIALTIAMVSAPLFAYADTTTTTSAQVQVLLGQIKNLQLQLSALSSAKTQVAQTKDSINQTFKIIRDLNHGISGDDVKALQAVLAADGTIFPDATITGFYGKKTEDAVKRFQKKHGIKVTGYVEANTLRKINDEILRLSISKENTDGTVKICVVNSPGHLIAKGWLKKNGRTEKSIISDCKNIPKGVWQNYNWNNASTTYQDKIAPSITNTSVSYTTLGASASSTINWTTNEIATGRVWYGTTTPLVLASPTLNVFSGTFELNHSLKLMNLATGTTYFYVMESVDLWGNKSTTTPNSFTIPQN